MPNLSSPTPVTADDASVESPTLTSAFKQAFREAWHDRFVRIVWLLAGVLGVIYSFVIMLGFGPDEPRHMNYIRLLCDEHRLPYLLAPGQEYAGAHTLHPPLYYSLLAPFYVLFRGLPGESEWHVLRLLSTVFCLACIPLWFAMARRLCGDLWAARLGVAALALLPIFGMTSGVINNDGPTLFFVTLFLWLLACPLANDQSWRGVVIMGVVFGLGGATKATALICDGAALFAFLCLQVGRSGWLRPRCWMRFGGVIALALAICGWWYARNEMLYGQLTPFEHGYALSDKARLLPPISMGVLTVMMHQNFPRIFMLTVWALFVTLWSQKDWIPEALRAPVWVALAVFCGLGLVGTLLRARLPVDRKTSAVWPSTAAFGANWTACIVMALFFHYGWAQGGRYLQPSLCGLVFPVALGWRALAGERVRLVALGWALFLLLLNIAALYWLVTFLNPTYGPSH